MQKNDKTGVIPLSYLQQALEERERVKALEERIGHLLEWLGSEGKTALEAAIAPYISDARPSDVHGVVRLVLADIAANGMSYGILRQAYEINPLFYRRDLIEQAETHCTNDVIAQARSGRIRY